MIRIKKGDMLAQQTFGPFLSLPAINWCRNCTVKGFNLLMAKRAATREGLVELLQEDDSDAFPAAPADDAAAQQQ